jgi:hemerythrin-like domain-containing protein
VLCVLRVSSGLPDEAMTRSLLAWQPPHPHAHVADLLADCHARIRYFASLAVRICDECCPVDAREAAARIRRYFVEAYPLHVADEHESILPRLRARAPESEPMLQKLESEHRCLESKLPELLALCDALEHGDEAACKSAVAKLRSLGECMHTLLDAHLDNEEQNLFPLLREKLTEEDVAAIRGEFRARRDSSHEPQ